MKYKYTRKEIVEKLVESVKAGVGYYKIDGSTFHEIKDNLLATGNKYENIAQKEDKKECKHKFGETYTGGKRCNKCNMSLTEFKYPTPSPLEIEEIEEMKVNKLSYASYNQWAKIMNKINSLISNQKKLYQLIKEKL